MKCIAMIVEDKNGKFVMTYFNVDCTNIPLEADKSIYILDYCKTQLKQGEKITNIAVLSTK